MSSRSGRSSQWRSPSRIVSSFRWGLRKRRTMNGPKSNFANVEAAVDEWEPLVGQPILAWRVWRVVERDDDLRLRSLTFEAVWPPRKRVEAVCMVQTAPPPEHLAPAPVEHPHECGIYALKEPEMCTYWRRKPSSERLRVWGRVALWGRVVVCQKGYRAEYAYPAGLVRNSEEAERLAELYGVELLEDPTGASVATGWRGSGE